MDQCDWNRRPRDLPNGTGGAKAYAVSADGNVIVGGSFTIRVRSISMDQRKWNAGLGTLPGSGSWAYGVSGDGSIIVGSDQFGGLGGEVASVWSSATGMRHYRVCLPIPELI